MELFFLSARVTASSLSDMSSAVVSAIGTLKGHFHGGANEQVMKNSHGNWLQGENYPMA